MPEGMQAPIQQVESGCGTNDGSMIKHARLNRRHAVPFKLPWPGVVRGKHTPVALHPYTILGREGNTPAKTPARKLPIRIAKLGMQPAPQQDRSKHRIRKAGTSYVQIVVVSQSRIHPCLTGHNRPLDKQCRNTFCFQCLVQVLRKVHASRRMHRLTHGMGTPRRQQFLGPETDEAVTASTAVNLAGVDRQDKVLHLQTGQAVLPAEGNPGPHE